MSCTDRLGQLVELAASFHEHSKLNDVAAEEIEKAVKELRSINPPNDDDASSKEVEITSRLSHELCMRLSWSSAGRAALNRANAWRYSTEGVLMAIGALLEDEEEPTDQEEWASELGDIHQFIILCSDLLSCPTSRPRIGDIPSELTVLCPVLVRSYQRLRSLMLSKRPGSKVEVRLLSSISFLAARLSAELEPSGLCTDDINYFLGCSKQDDDDFFGSVFEQRTAHFCSSSTACPPTPDIMGYVFNTFLPKCTHLPRLKHDCSSVLEALCDVRDELGLPRLVAGDDLNISITDGSSGNRTVSLAEGAASKECSGAQMSANELKVAYASGSTIVIRAIGSRINPDELSPFTPALRLQQALSHSLGLSTSSNVYITPPGRQGLACHSDDHDVFVVQVSGSKHWMIKELPEGGDERLPLSYQSLPRHAPLHKSDPGVIQMTLNPGDVLYIPRGAPHQATSLDEASIHVSVSLEVDADKCWGGLMRTALRSGCRDEEQWTRINKWLKLRMCSIHRRVCPLLANDGVQRTLMRSLVGSSSDDSRDATCLFLSAWKSLWSLLIEPEIGGLCTQDHGLVKSCIGEGNALAAKQAWQESIRARTQATRGFELIMARISCSPRPALESKMGVQANLKERLI